MADSVRVEVKGLRQLGENLKQLDLVVRQKLANQATGAAAGVIKKAAIANAPEYPTDHPLYEYRILIPGGNLKKQIVLTRLSKSKTEYTSEYLVRVRGGRKDYYAARYGRLVEYGTVKMKAQSFMRLAFDQEKGFAVAKMKETLEKGLEREAAKLTKIKKGLVNV